MPVTNTVANGLLNFILGKSSTIGFSAGSAYLALSTTAPTAEGGNITEPVGNGYERKLIGNSGQALTQLLSSAADGSITNDKIIMFNPATGSWGTCTHFVIYSAASGGTVFGYGTLTTPISPIAGSVPTIEVGDMVWTIS